MVMLLSRYITAKDITAKDITANSLTLTNSGAVASGDDNVVTGDTVFGVTNALRLRFFKSKHMTDTDL